jgi:molybdopterin adenylyltransferase
VKVAVITVSDRASRGEYRDLSGPVIETLLKERFPHAEIEREIVPDEREALLAAFQRHLGSDYILTTGGTGVSERDITPEVSAAFCRRPLPGVSEVLRARSFQETPFAMFSRGYAGIRERTILVNFPGSVKAVRLCTRVLMPVMEHGLKMIRGEGH